MRASSATSIFETLFSIAVATAGSVALLLSAALSSSRPRQLALWFRESRERTGIPLVQGRLTLGLVPLGVIAGLPIALGLLRANAFVLISALGACMVGRGVLSQIGRGVLSQKGSVLQSAAPFLAVSWAILAGVQRFDTLDLGAAMAAQSLLGPLAGFREIPSSWGALAIGLGGAAAWTASLPSLSGFPRAEVIDRMFRIGERALAGAAISAPLWGPSLGALVRGPLDLSSIGWVGLSFLVTAASVAAIAPLTKVLPRTAVVSWGLAAASGLILLAGEVLR